MIINYEIYHILLNLIKAYSKTAVVTSATTTTNIAM